MHLGLGNFHRAHQAVYTDAAVTAHGGDWGIIGVSSRSAAIPDAMHAQDMLYTVVEISPEGSKFSVPRVHTDAFTAAGNPDRVVRAIGDAATRIVSLTVTENGYNYTPATGSLNLQDPAIQHDLAHPEAPRTPIGQIVRGLQHRSRTHAEPVTILSCDNLADNGHHTQRLVREFASLLPSAEAAETLAFIDTAPAFPPPWWTGSCRPPRTTTAAWSRPSAATRTGSRSRPSRSRCGSSRTTSSPDAPRGRPAARCSPTRWPATSSSRCACSTAPTPSSPTSEPCPAPSPFPNPSRHTHIELAARSVLRNEYLPSVSVPAGVDVDAYEEQLFSRWRNTALGHRTSQVGSDGSVKLRQRIPLPALQMLDDGRMPQLLALTTAAYLSCIAPLAGFDPGTQAHAMEDPARGIAGDARRRVRLRPGTGRKGPRRAASPR